MGEEDLKGRKVLGSTKVAYRKWYLSISWKECSPWPWESLSIDLKHVTSALLLLPYRNWFNRFHRKFEPSATALEKQSARYVVASTGVDSGPYHTPLQCQNQLYGKILISLPKILLMLCKRYGFCPRVPSLKRDAEIIEPQFLEQIWIPSQPS